MFDYNLRCRFYTRMEFIVKIPPKALLDLSLQWPDDSRLTNHYYFLYYLGNFRVVFTL